MTMMFTALTAAHLAAPAIVSLKWRIFEMRRTLKKSYQHWRFGAITETVKAVDGGVPSEIEYRDCKGIVIGYWAYGSFDPSHPYRG